MLFLHELFKILHVFGRNIRISSLHLIRTSEDLILFKRDDRRDLRQKLRCIIDLHNRQRYLIVIQVQHHDRITDLITVFFTVLLADGALTDPGLGIKIQKPEPAGKCKIREAGEVHRFRDLIVIPPLGADDFLFVYTGAAHKFHRRATREHLLRESFTGKTRELVVHIPHFFRELAIDSFLQHARKISRQISGKTCHGQA